MRRLAPQASTSLILSATIGVVAFGLWACGPSPQQKYEQRVEQTGEPALHAVHSDRLQQIMADLNDVMYGRLPTMYDTDATRQKLLGDAKQVAVALRETAGQVVQIMPELQLSTEEAITFHSLATKLESQAKTLQEQADRNMVEALPDTLDQMRTTCTACHNLFQGPRPLALR